MIAHGSEGEMVERGAASMASGACATRNVRGWRSGGRSRSSRGGEKEEGTANHGEWKIAKPAIEEDAHKTARAPRCAGCSPVRTASMEGTDMAMRKIEVGDIAGCARVQHGSATSCAARSWGQSSPASCSSGPIMSLRLREHRHGALARSSEMGARAPSPKKGVVEMEINIYND